MSAQLTGTIEPRTRTIVTLDQGTTQIAGVTQIDAYGRPIYPPMLAKVVCRQRMSPRVGEWSEWEPMGASDHEYETRLFQVPEHRIELIEHNVGIPERKA